jgi:hypothetical protein
VIPVLTGFGLPVLAGCSDPQGRQAIRGTVIFQGQPLDRGNIEFVPAGGERTQAGAAVQNGRYAIPRDKGLVPGTYKVIIVSWDGPPLVPDTSESPGISVNFTTGQRIAARFNDQTILRVDVTKGGENTFDFQVD